MKVQRSINTPIRTNISWHERWTNTDKGIISCWEKGRELAQSNPALADKAKKDELPQLNWRGGFDHCLQEKRKTGTLHYLAQWQGLRNQDLDINTDEKITKICSKTGMKVTYMMQQK